MPTFARTLTNPALPQDDGKAIPSEQQTCPAGSAAPTMVRWTRPWTVPQRDDEVRARILALLRRWPDWPPPPWHWWNLHQALGGAVSTAQMRRLIDGLIADGLVVEVYEATGDRRQHRHLLVLADQWYCFEWGILVEVVWREDVLEGLGVRHAPWAGHACPWPGEE